ncbi:MAG: MarR family transcriptional regulator [Actinomycetota bacterium]|nr:MarR family transcriptional regulator [Actinomycetota bacterium]
MTTHERRMRFAEEVSLLFEVWGLPPMAGRVWAALLVTDQPHLSATDLREQIGASAGSISAALAALTRMGIIDRVWVPGDRRSYYATSTAALEHLLERKAEALTQMVGLAERGVEAFSDVDPAKARLEEMRDFYAWFDREFDVLIERWRTEHRAERGGEESS